jgi:4-hydroxybutyrate CoA-transferase
MRQISRLPRHIVDKIDDGSCIQLGIGGVGTAVGSFLKEKKELSIHSEMFVDSMVDLMECGAVTNSRKELLPGKTGFRLCLGK